MRNAILFLAVIFFGVFSQSSNAEPQKNWVLIFVLNAPSGEIFVSHKTSGNFETEQKCLEWFDERKTQFKPYPVAACVQIHPSNEKSRQKWVLTYVFKSFSGSQSVDRISYFDSSLSCYAFFADIKEMRSEAQGSCDSYEM